eukprot:GEMP01001893.1.p1 GENE.GEMP01001893.1~~GEMP01001893.1.p1  ORF type:complete len:703 (+),score=97.82 GEMP01001893.1:211-2319(+)
MAWKDLFTTSVLFRPLPWWIVISCSLYMLLKMHVSYVGSACSVLGMHEPLSSSGIKKKFRQISMCTHPDRLRGRLKRSPTDSEVRRGEVLFNRASRAKDELQDILARATKKKIKKKKIDGKWVVEVIDSDKPDPIVYCHERSNMQATFKQTIREGYREIKQYIEIYGFTTTFDSIYEYFWGIVSFEDGFMSSMLSLLWLSFCWKMIRNLIKWMWGIGFAAPFYLIQVFALAPIPTLARFFWLPFVRVMVYVNHEMLPIASRKVNDPEVKHTVTGSDDDPPSPHIKFTHRTATSEAAGSPSLHTVPQKVSEKTANVAAAADDRGKLRHRKRIKPGEETQRQLTRDEELEQQIRRKLYTDPEDSEDEKSEDVPTDAWSLVTRRLKGKEQLCRSVGAKNVQVELLVVLTKPILPLLMVVMFEQVWSGIVTSMLMWEFYRRIPSLFYEYHHLLCMIFGFLHSWIGVTASEVERLAGNDNSVQRLLWEWSYRDCLMIIILCLCGAQNAVHSSLGNEPAFTSSFASGIALRIFVASDFIQNLTVTKWIQEFTMETLRDRGIQVITADEMLVYGGGGVGDCGGGTLEMFVGEDWCWLLSRIVQAALCMLPLLYACMWMQRGIKGYENVRGSKNMYTRRLPRIFARLALGLGGLAQVILCLVVSFNTSHGGLYNFWLSVLVGIWFESILISYDTRGPVRSLVFLLAFCFT